MEICKLTFSEYLIYKECITAINSELDFDSKIIGFLEFKEYKDVQTIGLFFKDMQDVIRSFKKPYLIQRVAISSTKVSVILQKKRYYTVYDDF